MTGKREYESGEQQGHKRKKMAGHAAGSASGTSISLGMFTCKNLKPRTRIGIQQHYAKKNAEQGSLHGHPFQQA